MRRDRRHAIDDMRKHARRPSELDVADATENCTVWAAWLAAKPGCETGGKHGQRRRTAPDDRAGADRDADIQRRARAGADRDADMQRPTCSGEHEQPGADRARSAKRVRSAVKSTLGHRCGGSDDDQGDQRDANDHRPAARRACSLELPQQHVGDDRAINATPAVAGQPRTVRSTATS